MYNQNMETVQSTLEMLASQTDQRTSVFEVEILSIQDSSLALSGRLLNEAQLDALTHQFSNWKLDTASIQILQKGDLPRMHVGTNLTGLYDRPTLYLPLSSELCYGTGVEILEEEEKWVFTRQQDGYLGWIFKSHLTEGAVIQPTHLVLAPSCELRAQPDVKSEVTTRLVSGTGVALEEGDGEWAKVVANKTGWVPCSFLRAIHELPKSLEAKRKTLIDDSARMIGVPYVWGGISGNGIDCSGFVRLLHKWIGIDLPRDADMQYASAKPVEPPFEVGDLLFFREPGKKRPVTHVGISLGGWRMIHSSQANNGVYIEDVQEREALKQNFVSAGSFLR
jgi:cell wall-associated NlpC family hydrolase